MAYADFTYYQENFKGKLIKDESTFQSFSERASEYLDTVTFDRLADEELLSVHKIKIQKCCCALTEMFYKRNSAYVNGISTENMPKTSETIGAYSVSYENPYTYLQELSDSDADFRKSLKRTALQYLGNTDLMYRGVL